MLSVIVPTFDSAPDLQALLPVLVPAAVDGLVREVIAADAGSTDLTADICEDAGVRMVAGGLVAAGKTARNPWVLILPPDIRLPSDWAERLAAHLQRGLRPAVLRGVREPGLVARLRAVPSGLLLEASKLAGRSETRDVSDLARALGGGATRL